MITTMVERSRTRRLKSGAWVGRGAKRFDNRRDWLRLYAIMGGATFLLTAPILAYFLLLVAQMDARASAPLLPSAAFSMMLVELFGQLVELACAVAITQSYTVWVGEEGIETRTFGIATRRLPWNTIARVELHRAFGMHWVRAFVLGKKSPIGLPLYFNQTDALFREACV